MASSLSLVAIPGPRNYQISVSLAALRRRHGVVPIGCTFTCVHSLNWKYGMCDSVRYINIKFVPAVRLRAGHTKYFA